MARPPTLRLHPRQLHVPPCTLTVRLVGGVAGGVPLLRRQCVAVAECYNQGMKTMPTRIDGDLFSAAKSAGEVQSRSAAQQLDHWARIGRELEASPMVTHDAINKVLAGQTPYDSLPDSAQAMVRVAWDEQISAKIAGLDFEDRLQDAGQAWAEADAEGRAVVRNPRTNSA